ncbi:hypothetical protein ACVMIH_002381 [Bradyrhizobium sp. USDA 4503]
MRTSNFLLAPLLSAALLLGGCGLAVPELQDFGSRDQQIVMVQEIVHNVNCELRQAFNELHDKQGPTFMDGWGVSILLDFDITEKSTVAPSATWSPIPSPTVIPTLAGGVSGSSQAERDNKMHAFVTVGELLKAKRCDYRKGGFMLMQDNLKLTEWLFDAWTVQATKQADFTSGGLPADVLYHEVKFEVDTGANVTPSFKLRLVDVNDSGPFFSTSRNRVHDLQITLGPTDQGKGPSKKVGPSQAAANVALAALIGRSVGSAVRTALRPN